MSFSFQGHTCIPYLLVGHVVDGVPYLLIALVTHERGIEVAVVDPAPLRGCPRRQMDTIRPSPRDSPRGSIPSKRSKHLLAHPSVELTHTVDLLAGVAGEGRHAEALAVVVGVGAAHADKFIPGMPRRWG